MWHQRIWRGDAEPSHDMRISNEEAIRHQTFFRQQARDPEDLLIILIDTATEFCAIWSEGRRYLSVWMYQKE